MRDDHEYRSYDNSPVEYSEDGQLMRLRASAYGGCRVALAAAGIGLQPDTLPQKVQAVFLQGHEREGVILRRIRDEKKVDVKQRDIAAELVVVPGSLIIAGHADAFGIWNKKRVLIEVKALSPTEFQQYKKYKLTRAHVEAYPWQISAYYHSLKEEMALDSILYVIQERSPNGDPETDPIHVFEIPEPPHTKAQVMQKALEVKKLVTEAKVMFDEHGVQPECDRSDYFCPFRYLHVTKKFEESEHQAVELMREYNDVNEDYKYIAQRRSDLSKALLELVDKDDTHVVDGRKFAFGTVKRRDIDQVKLSELATELGFEIPYKETQYRQIRVYQPKDKSVELNESGDE
jgi:hypothetical protein